MNWKKMYELYHNSTLRLYRREKGGEVNIVLGCLVISKDKKSEVIKRKIMVIDPSDVIEGGALREKGGVTYNLMEPFEDFSHYCDIPDFDGKV